FVLATHDVAVLCSDYLTKRVGKSFLTPDPSLIASRLGGDDGRAHTHDLAAAAIGAAVAGGGRRTHLSPHGRSPGSRPRPAGGRGRPNAGRESPEHLQLGRRLRRRARPVGSGPCP